jgi:hypothetical protein
MSAKVLTNIALFVVSLGVGVAIGEWYFHLFLQAVPPVALSQFNSQSSRIAHWLYGVGVGLILWAWALMGMAISRLRQLAAKPKA